MLYLLRTGVVRRSSSIGSVLGFEGAGQSTIQTRCIIPPARTNSCVFPRHFQGTHPGLTHTHTFSGSTTLVHAAVHKVSKLPDRPGSNALHNLQAHSNIPHGSCLKSKSFSRCIPNSKVAFGTIHAMQLLIV